MVRIRRVEARMTELPIDASSRRQAFFEQDGVDQLVSMVLELATQVWVVRERLYYMERAAQNLGVPLVEAVSTYEPSAAEQAELASMRSRMLEDLFRTVGQEHRRLTSRPAAGVDKD